MLSRRKMYLAYIGFAILLFSVGVFITELVGMRWQTVLILLAPIAGLGSRLLMRFDKNPDSF